MWKQLYQLCIKLAVAIIGITVLAYDVLTLLVYCLLQKPWLKWTRIYQPRSAKVTATGQQEQAEIVVESIKTLPKHFLLSCSTIDQAFDNAIVANGADRHCIGYREVVNSETVPSSDTFDGRPLVRYELTHYRWLTYRQMCERIACFGHGLRLLGINKGDKVMIYADTSAFWFICGQGIIKNGSVLVTLYSTLGEQGIVHGIKETEVKTIITSKHLIEKLAKVKNNLAQIEQVIVLDMDSFDDQHELEQIRARFDGRVQVHTMADVIESGDSEYYQQNPANLDENDLAIIMYTSGSGGIPKGVKITHRNFMQGMCSVLSLVNFFLHEMHRHTYIGYLPLAHILEFATETFLLLAGARVGYATPHTLTDLSVGLKPGTKGDATLLQPTLMASVPLVLDRIRKAIYNSLNEKGLFAVKLFEFIIEYKTFWLSKGFETPLLDALFLQKFRQIVGGKLEILMAGGAPLAADTQKLVRACLNVVFSQGYGATETVATGLFMDEHDHTLAKVGGPLFGTKVKLVDWPEGGYCTGDKPNPRGEIHISSDSLSVGYFKLDKLTKQTYYTDNNGDRWLRTGDIGELFPNGTFKIIDRKKDFIKLQFGEYVSLGKIETKLKTSYLVNNICVVGNSLYRYLIAIVIPNGKALEKIASQLYGAMNKTNDNGNIDDLCSMTPKAWSNEKVKKIFTRKLTRFAKTNGLRRYEIPKEFLLVNDEWTPESGLVTASFKLKRKNIQQFYSELVEETFGKLE